MAETRRKLTTILSADVQDYTRLMGQDEEGTLATLKRYRDAMARLIAAHGGRVVNTWGDGLIAEFPSVVEAVRAAVDTQNELASHNLERSPTTRMMFRIGINLGDVIADGEDIYGDGVNIAARLQSQAEPGGIVISNTVYDQVRNKIAVGFDFLGPLSVKNVNEAIPSYAIRVGEAAAGPQPPLAGGRPDAARHGGGPSRTREPEQAWGREPPTRAASLIDAGTLRTYRILAIATVVLLVVNAATWHGEFWAKWPLLAFATIAAIVWSLRQRGLVREFGVPVTIMALLVLINLFSWGGTAWAQWPVLGISAAMAIRWAIRART
jgi:class 3 adenylate cyclase